MTLDEPRTDHTAEAERLFTLQREHRWVAKRSNASHRRESLNRLKEAITDHAEEVIAALYDDLGKPPRSSKIAELGTVLHDIDEAVARLDEWMAPTRVQPAARLGVDTRAEIRYEGRGVVLLFGPWNFPFSLVFQPLVPIVAAGNTCIVKPNELAPATSDVTARIIRSVFDERHVAVLEGGVDVAEQLLDLPVDHVFFTGSPAVGKIVMAKAAQHLASVTLELGGKCPAIIDSATDLSKAVQTIAFGKHENTGQICLAPDHVWVHEDLRDQFVAQYLEWVSANIPAERVGRLVNSRNAERVRAYVADAVLRGATATTVHDQDGGLLGATDGADQR